MNKNTYINLKNISLVYDLYYDKTHSIKEYIVNFIHRRKYVNEKVGKLFALNNLSLEIGEGERIGIIGLNGAGKSTLLKVISGILKPTYGIIDIEGNVQPLIEVAAGFNPEFSGRENMYLNGAMLGFVKREIAEKEQDIIRFSELENFIDVPVKYYSTGMSVRLAFSIATMIKPEILLLDEMLSAGDISFASKAKMRLDELLSITKILLLVSHNLDLINSSTERTLVMHKGKIVFDGKTEDSISYYKEMVQKINQENKQQGLDKKYYIEKIVFNKVYCHNTVDGSNIINPNDSVSFIIEFNVKFKVENIKISLVILNDDGIIYEQLNNEMVNLDIVELSEGKYKLNLTIPSIRYKSGIYNFNVSIRDITNHKTSTMNSGNIQFEISGNKKLSDTIHHSWKLINENGSPIKIVFDKEV